MFFMMGITDGRKDFDFVQTVICDVCGKYGRYQVFMTYTVLSLFLIPCFKWNRHNYVQIEILPQHLRLVNRGGYSRGVKRCSNCGYETAEDFEFCPKCGMRF